MSIEMHVLFFCLLLAPLVVCEYQIGRGIADVTGLPADGILTIAAYCLHSLPFRESGNLLLGYREYGYGSTDLDARGIHTRQYSRAYAFDDGQKRAVVVVAEVTMISQAVHREVMEQLEERFDGLYGPSNVILSPTHSHATPGGYHTYFMYVVPSTGFETQTFRTLVDGIVLSVERAHNDFQPAKMFLNSGDLYDANVNRSPHAYDQNPEEERAQYDSNVDVEMSLLRLETASGEPMGALSFFPVHTTSMKNTNHLINTDNKGYASQMMERELNNNVFPPKGSQDILTAFLQTAMGDASPNIELSRCEGTDELCSDITSTCPEDPGSPLLCLGRGPTGRYLDQMDDIEDTKIIGERQANKALELYFSEGVELTGKVDHKFTFVNMTEQEVEIDGEMVQLCPPNMGYSFGAGATDGPGYPPFHQGMTEPLENLEQLLDRLFPNLRPDWLKECAASQPLLLPTGLIERPYPHWQPSVVPVQLIRIADIILIGMPAEITTMAGRRLVNAVKQQFADAGEPDIKPFVLSMANSYSSYVTTKEEYSVQRYEGASVIFGPNSLLAYTNVVLELGETMIKDEDVNEWTWPPDLRGFPDEARGRTLIDLQPENTAYGDVIVDVESTYARGDIVQAIFVAGNPRNEFYLFIDDTYMEVQRLEDDWTTVYTDAHWETKFYWDSDCHGRPAINVTGCGFEQTSNMTIEWTIGLDEVPGTYRLIYKGFARLSEDQVVPYTYESSSFTVGSLRRRRLVHEMNLPRPQGFIEIDDKERIELEWQREWDSSETNVINFMKKVAGHW